MIRFTCPDCDKPLRAEESQAGSTVKCPACGHQFTIPYGQCESEAPETDEPQEDNERQEPAPRRKKRKVRQRITEEEMGRRLIIGMACLFAGTQLLSMVRFLATFNPRAAAERQAQQAARDSPNGIDKMVEPDPREVAGGNGMREAWRLKLLSFLKRYDLALLTDVLFILIYFRHDWARRIVAGWFLLSCLIAIFGLITGAFPVWGSIRTGIPFLAPVELCVGFGINFGIGMTLLKSRSIHAYMAGR